MCVTEIVYITHWTLYTKVNHTHTLGECNTCGVGVQKCAIVQWDVEWDRQWDIHASVQRDRWTSHEMSHSPTGSRDGIDINSISGHPCTCEVIIAMRLKH